MGLRSKGSLVRFPVRAHTWVVVQVLSGGHVRGNHTLMFLSLSSSLPSPLSKNKEKIFKIIKILLFVLSIWTLRVIVTSLKLQLVSGGARILTPKSFGLSLEFHFLCPPSHTHPSHSGMSATQRL